LKVISKEISSLHEVVGNLKSEVGGELKIGVIPTVAPYLLPVFLSDFIKQFPKVHFVVSEMTTEKIIEQVKIRDLDVGIVSTPLDQKDLLEIPLYDEPFLFYDQSARNVKSPIDVSSIDYDRLWLLEEGHCMRTQVQSICGMRKKRVNIGNLEYKLGAINTLMKFVRKNNGATLLPYLSTLEFSKKEEQHLRKFKTPVPARSIGLIVHKHFVKHRMAELLQLEIQEKVLPLLKNKSRKQKLVSPV